VITLDENTCRLLLELPINETRTIKIDDRQFTIVDTEEFLRIVAMAGLKVNAPVAR
jgi:hypothetical protein